MPAGVGAGGVTFRRGSERLDGPEALLQPPKAGDPNPGSGSLVVVVVGWTPVAKA